MFSTWTAADAARQPEPATKAEIEEALAHAVHAARRTFQRVGNDLLPTKWDDSHRFIDRLLHQWESATE